ncbi:MAG: deoxynucleoside kinase, partial [Leuconostoc falkenbergense]
YDASPKLKIDLQTYDLEQKDNQQVILNQIDDALKAIR